MNLSIRPISILIEAYTQMIMLAKCLQGMTVGQSMDFMVAEAAKRGLLIMFDMHCVTAKAGITDLWHLDQAFPEEKVVHAWKIMVSRYVNPALCTTIIPNLASSVMSSLM